MNLYLVERTDRWGYDEYDAIVVAAQTEDDARLTHPDGRNNWDGEKGEWDSWTGVGNLTVTKIGKAYKQPAGVILASFNAG